MNTWQTYRYFLLTAVALHGLLAAALLWEHTTTTTSMTAALAAPSVAQNVPEVAPEVAPEMHSIQAESVDAREVQAAVSQLKQARDKAAQAERAHQQALRAEVALAQQKRLAEQRRIDVLKAEAIKLAEAQKQRVLDEQKRITALQQQKAMEQQKLLNLQAQQRQLQLQQQAHEAAEKKASLLRAQQAEAARAADAANKSRIAGVVEQYKARIVHAISQQWILPEHADSRLSSQFRIRLSPNGTVLEVSLIRSSGDPVLDRSAQSAIYKASPLPVPVEPELFRVFRDISLTVRPENTQG